MGYVPPVIPAPNIAANPDMATLLKAIQNNVAVNLNCHAVGTIQSFSQGKNLDGTVNGLYVVNVQVNYARTYFTQGDANSQPQAQIREYPLLLDCPLVIMGGGNTYLQFPIAVGDQCLVFFNDRDLNNWYAGARTGPVATARTHSIADAIALVGFQNVPTYDMSHALLTNGNAAIGVPSASNGRLVRIANRSSTLNGLLQQLISDIQAITIIGGAVSPVSQAALIADAQAIATLLE